MAEDDDEGAFGGLYDDGHWVWDESIESLTFVRNSVQKSAEAIIISKKAPTGTVEFRDDVDVMDQLRFRKRYQRKLNPGQPDIITLQDIKDIALFTAPMSLLNPMLIKMLHMPTTERFIRALIICLQYYLQVTDIMTKRMEELDTKVGTPECRMHEAELNDNITDLRILVCKEYATMLIGGNDMKRFHHMGALKKRRSLTDKDARLIETLLRMSVQIVWLALGRKAYHQIELEVNRLFKSDIFNSTEHNLKTGYIAKMTKEEKAVLLGECLRHDKKLTTSSPLLNEAFRCHRQIDYRLPGVGVIKYDDTLPSRYRYMAVAISAPEEDLAAYDVTVGILGLPRARFDTMLRPVVLTGKHKSSSIAERSAVRSAKSAGGMPKSMGAITKIYDDIVLPPKDFSEVDFPDTFPDKSDVIRSCSAIQLKRWQYRLKRLSTIRIPT